MPRERFFTIGELAERTGLAVSAIRFYESRGLVAPERSAGGQRRFRPGDMRRLSFVMIAQQLGFSLTEIEAQLADLPNGRTPTQRDWKRISQSFQETLDARIAALERMRRRLDGCIGCGCLSLKNCALYNPDDRIRANGPGPRFIISDETVDA